MHAEGKRWREIFAMCLPDRALYDSSEAYRTAKQGLKKAVRQREKRSETRELSDSATTPATNSA